MAKYTDEQIKKALKCCVNPISFDDCLEGKCPMASEDGCEVYYTGLYPYILAIINRQEAEKNALIAGQETLQKYLAEKEAEIDRLKEEQDRALDECLNCGIKREIQNRIITAKSEAIKEFAEVLRTRLNNTEYKLTSNAKCVTTAEEKSTIDWILHKYVIRIIDEVEYGMVGEGE